MKRLIDGTELLRHFSISPSGERYKLRDCDGFYTDVHLEEVQRRIADSPTVDAVPVVRCKDCLYLQRNNMTCELHYETVSPDYFCASGKDWRNEKIEIKLKECCLKCEHFDPSGIQGLSSYPISCCGEPERVIACGHMAACKEYLELNPPSCCELERREIVLPKEGAKQDGMSDRTRPCWWHGKPAKFHMWSYGVPFHHFSCALAPKECTIGILEDENGRIVNARPEDIRFLDTAGE